MAVAGFSSSEIELTQQGNTLLVSGQKAANDDGQGAFLHRGIANRNFRQTFSLADHVKVSGAGLENGLLAIRLVRSARAAETAANRHCRFFRHGDTAQADQPGRQGRG